jgi:hypothetical protein
VGGSVLSGWGSRSRGVKRVSARVVLTSSAVESAVRGLTDMLSDVIIVLYQLNSSDVWASSSMAEQEILNLSIRVRFPGGSQNVQVVKEQTRCLEGAVPKGVRVRFPPWTHALVVEQQTRRSQKPVAERP